MKYESDRIFESYTLWERISFSIRSWWNLNVSKAKEIPLPLREYYLASALRAYRKGYKDLSPADREKIVDKLLDPDKWGAFLNIGITGALVDECVALGMEIVGSIPGVHCKKCDSPVLEHRAYYINMEYYCVPCGESLKGISKKV